MFFRQWKIVSIAAALATAWGCAVAKPSTETEAAVESLVVGGSNGDPVVVTYPAAPNAVQSTTFAVKVNGQPVFVEENRRISHAHFAFAGEVTVEVSVAGYFGSYTISPEVYNIQSTAHNDDMSFTIDRPRKLVLHEINNWADDFVMEKRLFIFADAIPQAADELGEPQLVTSSAAGIDNTGATDVSAAIQGQLDSLSASGGGALVLEPGLYKVQSVFLKDDTTLYLEGGARIQGSDTPGPEDGIIKFADVDNAKLMGPGSVSANGVHLKYTHGKSSSVIRADRASNVLVQDVTLLDPSSFAVWVRDSEQWTMYNTKQIDYDNRDLSSNGGNDGIDPDASRDVLVDNCFVYAGDDATAIKGITPTWSTIDNITFRNNVIFQSALGSGLGTGSQFDNTHFNTILFENNDVVKSRFAVDMGMRSHTSNPGDEPFFQNVKYRGNRFGMTRGSFPFGGNARRDALYKDVTFENNVFEGNNDGNLPKYETFDTARMMDWHFDGVYYDGQLLTSTSQMTMNGTGFSGFTFANSNHQVVTVDANDTMVSEGGSASFQITRSGDISKGLVVYYELRGTAENGVDYNNMPGYVWMGPGQASEGVTVNTIADSQNEGVEPVVLSLSTTHSSKYMLVGNHDAMITIDDR